MTLYEPIPLSQLPPGRFTQLVAAAKQRQLVIYLGAGISMAEPSCGPSGWAVADALRPYVANLLDVDVTELDGLSLEALAERLVGEDAERLEALRVRASEAADFRGITPNFGHEVAALLLREGAVELITVNWDCGIETAGREAGFSIRGVAGPDESVEIGYGLKIFKVHGCATRPPTLAITKAEVDKPQSWAVGRVQGALAGGVVAFVGLGTVGLYVCEPVEDLVTAWGQDASSVVIADPVLSESWKSAFGDAEKATDAYIKCDADCFLDDLLRALVLEALDLCEQQIRALPQDDDWVAAMLNGFGELRKALAGTSANGAIRWWRDGLTDDVDGQPFIVTVDGGRSLMTVALLAGNDGGDLDCAGQRGRFTVASTARYFEVVSRPGKAVTEVERVGRQRIRQRLMDGVYPKLKPISVVVAGANGRFPSEEAPVDISAGAATMSDVAEGPDAVPIRFFAAEAGAQGRLAA
jgi:hypothetical protein